MPSDQELVTRLQSGDDCAFDEIMQRYKRPVCSFIYRMLYNETDADDAAQEVFLRVYRHIGRFKADGRRQFSTWLFQIARNQAIDVLRKRKRRPFSIRVVSEDQGEEAISPERSADRVIALKEVEHMVARSIAKLPEKQKTAVILAEYHDLSHAEIAAVMKCSVKSVESRLGRARQTLRNELAELM